MRNNLLLFTFLIYLNLQCVTYAHSSQTDSINLSKVSQILYDLKNEFAPDVRLAIFDVKIGCEFPFHIVLSGKTNQLKAIPKLEEILNSENISFENKISLLPSDRLGENKYGVVNHSVVNLRSEPDHASDMTSQVLLGMPVLILEELKGWYRVQTPDNYIAYTEKSSISTYNTVEMNKWTKDRKIVFWSDYGFSYEEPNLNSQRVSDLTVGNILKYISTEGKFIKVSYPDNRIAYIEKSSCKDFNQWIKSPNPSRQEITRTALKLMGIPYLWGGTSLKGMDCSGFTKMVFYLNGIIIQRDASQQAQWGSSIETDDSFDGVQTADLLFFGMKTSITHVGLYLGNRKFIDASGNISINSFDPADKCFNHYRLNTFIISKNYIDNVGTNGIMRIEDSAFYNLR